MRLSYDREQDILMIEVLPDERIDHGEHSGPFIAHLAEDGRLVLLEVLDASEFLAEAIRTTLRSESQQVPAAAA